MTRTCTGPCGLKSLDSEADDPLMVPSLLPDEWALRPPAPDSRGGFVLIVDDETPVLLALRRILDADRHEVALASSLAEAESSLVDPALDVVLVDLVMGEASGLDLLERVRRRRPEVEVIVMTGYASVDSAVDCMRRGAFDYLSKPFEDLRRVRETVRRAVQQRRLADSACRAPGEGTLPPVGDGQPWLRGSGGSESETRESGHGAGELPLSLEAYEKSALERALQESAGDAGAAARRLGIGRSTLYRKLAKHGIGDGRASGAPSEGGSDGVGSHSSIG